MASTLPLTGTGNIFPDRATSGPGPSLTIQAGGSEQGSQNQNGGDLILSSGTATGYASSKVELRTATACGPITEVDSTPTNGGSGYAVNDVLGIIGGSYINFGRVTVSDVDDNVVTSLSLVSGGTGYSTGTNNETTGGTGSGCTVDITAVSGVITDADINAGGSGFRVGDDLNVIQTGASGGQIQVNSVDGNGAVLSLSIEHGGNGYTTGNGLDAERVVCTVDITCSSGVITGIAFSSPNGGSGYTQGDVLTVSGGNDNGTVKVESVANGVVKSVSFNPTTGGGSEYKVTGEGNLTWPVVPGTGSTVNITSISGSGSITGITLSDGGSGYHVGDILTVVGGSGGQVNVAGVSSGVVTSLTLKNGGSGYSTGSDIDTTMASSGNSGCTVNVITITDTNDRNPTAKIAVLGNGNTGLGTTSPAGLFQLGSSYIVAAAPTGNAERDLENINAAIAEVSTSTAGFGGGTVYLQAGGYVINDTIYSSATYPPYGLQNGLKIIGAGMGTNDAGGKTTIRMDNAIAKPVFEVLYAGSAKSITIKDLSIQCVSGQELRHTGIKISHADATNVENVLVADMDVGIFITNSMNNFRNIMVTGCNTGIQLGGTGSGDFASANYFYGGSVGLCKKYGIRFVNAWATVVCGLSIEYNLGPEMVAAVSMETPEPQGSKGVGHNHLIGCFFEGNDPCNIRIASPGNNITNTNLGVSALNPVTFLDNGLNDLSTNNDFTFTGSPHTKYRVQIVAGGTTNPNTFKWSDNDGSTWSDPPVSITGGDQPLGSNGITIKFGSTTGHTAGDQWFFVAGITGIDIDSGWEYLNTFFNNWEVNGYTGMIRKDTMLLSDTMGVGTLNPNSIFQVDQQTMGPGIVAIESDRKTVTGSGTQFMNTFKVGDQITINFQTKTITAINTDTELSVDPDTFSNSGPKYSYTLTGGTRLAVNGNGNVGVGAYYPLDHFQVQSDAVTGTGTISSSAVNNIVTAGTAGAFDNVNVGDEMISSGQARTVTYKASGTSLLTSSRFDPVLINNSWAYTTPRLLVRADGAVGIHNPVPTEKLAVGSATAGGNILQSAQNGWRDGYKMARDGTVVAGMGVDSNNTGLQLFTGSSLDNNTAKLTILSDGKTGVGTVSPGSKLEVVGESSSNSLVTIGANSGSQSDKVFRILKDTSPVEESFTVLRSGVVTFSNNIVQALPSNIGIYSPNFNSGTTASSGTDYTLWYPIVKISITAQYSYASAKIFLNHVGSYIGSIYSDAEVYIQAKQQSAMSSPLDCFSLVGRCGGQITESDIVFVLTTDDDYKKEGTLYVRNTKQYCNIAYTVMNRAGEMSVYTTDTAGGALPAGTQTAITANIYSATAGDVSLAAGKTLSVDHIAEVNGGHGVVFDNNVGIGIGTASPGSQLQVNGNAAIGYSASTAGPTNGLAVSGSVGINLASPASPNTNLDVNGDFAMRENSPAQITANQDDHTIGSYSVLRLISNGSYNITGFAGGVQGKFLYIINVNVLGSGRDFTLKHDTTSTAANRIYTQYGNDCVLAPFAVALLWYDSTSARWRVLK